MIRSRRTTFDAFSNSIILSSYTSGSEEFGLEAQACSNYSASVLLSPHRRKSWFNKRLWLVLLISLIQFFLISSYFHSNRKCDKFKLQIENYNFIIKLSRHSPEWFLWILNEPNRQPLHRSNTRASSYPTEFGVALAWGWNLFIIQWWWNDNVGVSLLPSRHEWINERIKNFNSE